MSGGRGPSLPYPLAFRKKPDTGPFISRVGEILDIAATQATDIEAVIGGVDTRRRGRYRTR